MQPAEAACKPMWHAACSLLHAACCMRMGVKAHIITNSFHLNSCWLLQLPILSAETRLKPLFGPSPVQASLVACWECSAMLAVQSGVLAEVCKSVSGSLGSVVWCADCAVFSADQAELPRRAWWHAVCECVCEGFVTLTSPAHPALDNKTRPARQELKLSF